MPNLILSREQNRTQQGWGHALLVGVLLVIGFILLFTKLSAAMLNQELIGFDETLNGILSNLQSPLTTVVMKAITSMGSPAVLISLALTVALLLGLVKWQLWDSLMVLVALLGSYGSNEYLKGIFLRERPNTAQLIEVTGYSFPSGHAMIGLTFYGLLAYLVWSNVPHRPLRTLLALTLSLLALVIGISRIYLGVHYPSDVLAGYAAGGCWLVGCILGLQAIRIYKSNRVW